MSFSVSQWNRQKTFTLNCIQPLQVVKRWFMNTGQPLSLSKQCFAPIPRYLLVGHGSGVPKTSYDRMPSYAGNNKKYNDDNIE